MKFLNVLLLLALALCHVACREKEAPVNEEKKESEEYFTVPPENVPELDRNGLAKEPTRFLAKQSTSTINWQPWSPDVLGQAERAQRMIFVFVGSTTHPLSEPFLTQLEEKFGKEINEDYLPVLADTETNPALPLGCHLLANERKDAISFPYLLWLSHEGNPVAWIPISSRDEDAFLLGFRNAQNTVQAIQSKSSRYVVENSRYDNEGRLNRIAGGLNLTDEALAKAKQTSRSELFLAAQSLCDLYDNLDKTFDNTGGIPPGHLITTLARISKNPACPPRLKSTAEEATRDAVNLLVQSAIRDPLDSYFFARRNSRSFAIPALIKKMDTQAEMLSAMTSSPPTAATQRAVSELLKALATRPLQDHAVATGENEELGYIWSIDELGKLLSKDELAIAKSAFQLRSLGNVPSSDDPSRKYFRRNTLGLAKFGPELASATTRSEEEAEALLASVRTKILARRSAILEAGDGLLVETAPILATKSRLLTALTRAQAADPNAANKEAVESLGNEIITRFRSEDGHLLRIPGDEGNRAISGFASDYVFTIEALMEWYRVSWKAELIQIAGELTTILLDEFLTEENRFVEKSVEESILTFPSHGESMIFGPSVWGTGHGVLKRMATLGFEHPKLAPALDEMTPFLNVSLQFMPVIHTDFLYAALNNFDGFALVLSKEFAEGDNSSLQNALAKAQFDSVAVVIEGSGFNEFPSTGSSDAILMKQGEVVAKFETSAGIIPGLGQALAK